MNDEKLIIVLLVIFIILGFTGDLTALIFAGVLSIILLALRGWRSV